MAYLAVRRGYGFSGLKTKLKVIDNDELSNRDTFRITTFFHISDKNIIRLQKTQSNNFKIEMLVSRNVTENL